MDCRQVELVELPRGEVKAGNFGVVDAECPEPEPGQVLVRLRVLGLNAGLARRLGGEGTAYGPGIGVGDVPASDAVVEVLHSASADFRPGDLAVCTSPWRTVQVCDAGDLRPISSPEAGQTLETHLTVLGHVGFTAYTGIIHIGDVQATDTVYVSAAAGGVGSCAVQFAKAQGATVIGSAGSAEKVSMITGVLGADHAFNRHDGPALELLRNAAPNGIDLYYDNVGGEQLEAALDWLNFGGRVVVCGAVAQGAQPSGPANYRRLIYQELTMRGFTVTAHEDLRPEFESTVGNWLEQGKVRSVHTTFDGFDRIPEAFVSLLAGGSKGRVIVSVG